MKIGIYIRVSTEEQARDGFSISAQENILRAWATIKGCPTPEMYVDEGWSAKNLRRPQVMRLLEDCRARLLDFVIVWRLDRLSRSLRDTVNLVDDDLRANGVELVSTTENIDTSTPAGRLMLNVLASFAQNEREVTEERVRMVCEDIARRECRCLGGVPPLGYMVDADKRYVINPVEVNAARSVFEMYARGAGYKAICAMLNATGLRSRQGRTFAPNSILEMLRNEKYIGVYVYNKVAPARRNGTRNSHENKAADEIVRVPGGVPAIIDMDTWERVQRRRTSKMSAGGWNKAKEVYVLSGLVKCGGCGRRMQVENRGNDRDGTRQRYYKCRDNCVRRIRVEKLDKIVVDYIRSLYADPDVLRRAAEIANETARQEHAGENSEVPELRARIDEIKARSAALVDFVARAGASAPVSIADELRALDAERQSAETAIVRAERTVVVIDPDALIARMGAMQRLAEQSPEERRDFIRSIVREVIITDKGVRVVIAPDVSAVGGGVATPLICTSDEIARS